MSSAYHQYVSRVQAILQQGVRSADILFLTAEGAPNVFLPPASAVEAIPTEDMNQFGFDPGKDAIIKTSTRSKKEFLPDRKGFNFDGCSPGILMRKAFVNNGKIMFEGGATYEILILPQTMSMTPELLQKIESLVKDGATVMGLPPSQSPSLVNYPVCDTEVKNLSKKMWSTFDTPEKETEIRYGKGKILWGGAYSKSEEGEIYPNYKTIENYLLKTGLKLNFRANGNIRYIHKKMSDTDVFFVSNKTNVKVEVNCHFRTNWEEAELWNPLNGEIRPLPQIEKKDGIASIPLQFDAYEAYFVVFGKYQKIPGTANLKNFNSKIPIDTLSGSWNVFFDPQWGGPGHVRFNQLKDWIERPEDGIKYYSGKAVYKKYFDFQFPGSYKKLFINLGSVNCIARVKLNDKDLGIIWTTPLEVEATGVLKEKNNKIEIEVANLWGNRLIGDERYENDGIKDGHWPEWVVNNLPRPSKRLTFTSWSHYTQNDSLQSSGLLGPVTVLYEN